MPHTQRSHSLLLPFLFLLVLPFAACDDSDSKGGCGGVTCSDHGTCVEDEEGVASCECDGGYESVDLACVERFTIDGGLVSDNVTGVMFVNPPVDHLVRDAAIAACENLDEGGYDDWFLPDSDTLGAFHREMNAAGTPPDQLFDHCLAEVTTDGYVRTKKGAEDYGGTPGDTIGFTGAANVRCARELP